ncbi:MAG: class I SAM-dependent methyltransferase [Candidatus ainarchaeum sp.]|nr:class I SAM-dependent methyltransferase [Candidatus ainarchaeum sp.]
MELTSYYRKTKPTEKELNKFKITYDKKSQNRPAWIKIDGLEGKVKFIEIHLGKKGRNGRRKQFYRTYLPLGLFLPIDYTSEEMSKYYDKFAETYDKEIKETGYNTGAAKFLIGKIKKYVNKNPAILDLGAGTGIVNEVYALASFKNMTLVDFSKGMLDDAKKKPALRGCKFIRADIRKLNLKGKYDLITSHFSLGNYRYINEEDVDKILKKFKKNLTQKGIIAIIGHFNLELFRKHFKELKSGIYTLNKSKKLFADYFIGRK